MKPRAAAAAPPKCARCQGWGVEPDAHPLANCTACGGTARPPAAPPPPRTGELIDG